MELTSEYKLLAEQYLGDTGNGNVYIRTYAKCTIQQIEQNRSAVTVKSVLYLSAGTFTTGQPTKASTWASEMDGVGDKDVHGTYSSGETILTEIGGWITHNADGTYSNGYATTDFKSTPWGWNGTAYGTFSLKKIPRYATCNQSLNSKTETTIKMNWSSDNTIDYVWYSKNNGTSWTAVGSVNATSGSYSITGLTPNTTYNIKTRVRRKDSQLATDSNTLSVTTYNYPYITKVETSNLIIGNKQKLTLYNPLSRIVTVKMNKDSASGTQLYSGTTSSTSIEFTPTASTLYASIPSSKSGKCVYSVIYSSLTKTTSQYTYAINETNCKPTFSNFTYADTDTTITSLTGNNQILVNNNSNCKFIISSSNKAVAKNSASITKYKFEWGSKSSEATYSASAEVTSTINDSTGNILKVTAIDSRGLSTTVTKTITNILYAGAVVNEVTATRNNGIETKTYLSGKFTIWKGNWQNGSNTNYDNQLKYVGYRVYDGSNWTSYFDITSKVKSAMSSYSNSNYTIITLPISAKLEIHANGTSSGFTIGKSYTIQILIKDGNSNATFTPYSYQATRQGTVPDGKVGFSRYKDSSGNYHYAINGMPDSSYTMKIVGKLLFNGATSSGDMYVTKSSGDTYFRAKRSDTGTEVMFGVGSGGANHGIYSMKMNKWLVYSDGTNGYLNGNATNVTQKKSLTKQSDSGFGTNNGYVPDMSFIAYWNGAYASNNASNLQYAYQGIIQCKPKELYNNGEGTNGTVTLNQTSVDFSRLTIYYYTIQDGVTGKVGYNSISICSPNGKSLLLSSAFPDTASKYATVYTKKINISGKNITVDGTRKPYYANIYADANSGWGKQTNNIYIIRVEGYK